MCDIGTEEDDRLTENMWTVKVKTTNQNSGFNQNKSDINDCLHIILMASFPLMISHCTY